MAFRRVTFCRTSCYVLVPILLVVHWVLRQGQGIEFLPFQYSGTSQNSRTSSQNETSAGRYGDISESTVLFQSGDERLDENIRCGILQGLPHAADTPIQQYCKGGPLGLSSIEQVRRISILVRGESFRGFSGFMDRSIQVNNRSYICQSRASDSHVKHLIQPLEACGYQVDVFLKTWQPDDKKWSQNGSAQLIAMYGGRVVNSDFSRRPKRFNLPTKTSPQAEEYSKGLRMVVEYSKQHRISWDALLIIRFDLFFKRPLGSFDFHKWAFAFKQADGVADTIHWIPWKYLNCALLDGFKVDIIGEGIAERIGRNNVAHVLSGLHNGNTYVDWNPLYKQCRPEQRFDIVGGFAVLLFSVARAIEKDVQETCLSVRSALAWQGVPRIVEVSEMVLHAWVRKPSPQLKRLVADVCVPKLNEAVYQDFLPPFNGMPWRAAIESMRQGVALASVTSNFKKWDRETRSRFGKRFQFDRMVFVRLDYKFVLPHISVYKCDVDKFVCVGFGAERLSELPVIIIASQSASKSFAKRSNETSFLEQHRGSNFTHLLSNAFGLPIKPICRGSC